MYKNIFYFILHDNRKHNLSVPCLNKRSRRQLIVRLTVVLFTVGKYGMKQNTLKNLFVDLSFNLFILFLDNNITVLQSIQKY